MRLHIDTQLRYALDGPTEVLLDIEPTTNTDQIVVHDLLTVTGAGPLTPVAGEYRVGQRTWFTATGGNLDISYQATVDVERSTPDLMTLVAAPNASLPPSVIAGLFPSRYCEADRLLPFVTETFGELSGGPMVAAMAQWITEHMDYVPGSSDATTSAVDSFVARRGVCRDFAHLLIAFVRAGGVPARMVSAYAWQLDPPDFHAVVDVWLMDAAGHSGWRLVDATRLAPVDAMVRIAAGRDATDISFMTVFGSAEMVEQQVAVSQVAP